MTNKDIVPPKIDFLLAPPDLVCKGLAAHCRAHRKNRKLTQEQLGKRAGLSRKTVTNFEAGNIVDLETFVRILTALNLLDRLATLQFMPPERSPLEAAGFTGHGAKRGNR